MAPKRARSDECAHPKPKALKTLEEHGILNGQLMRQNWYKGYYKSQGLPDGLATTVASYLLHTDKANRQRLLELMAGSETTTHNMAKVIEKYKEEKLALEKSNQDKARCLRSVLVIDSSGILH